MSQNEQRPFSPKMSTSLKENLIDRMRNTHHSSERNRMARSEREAPVTVRRKQPRFEDMPEYKQVLTQQLASQQLHIDNPFYRAHETAAGATTVIDGRKLINFASYDYLGLNRHPAVLAQASGRFTPRWKNVWRHFTALNPPLPSLAAI